MIQNESETDRLIRAVVGVILLLVGLNMESGAEQSVMLVMGIVLLITGFTGFCLIYKLLGISTIK